MKGNIRKNFFSLDGLRRGEKEDFEALFFKMHDNLYFLAIAYVKVNEIAEDLVQDAFMQLWKNRKDLNDDTNTLNYLYTLVKHNCLNYLKHLEVQDRYIRHKSIAELQFYQKSLNSLPDGYDDLLGIKQDLDNAIEKLPEDLKEIFLLNRFSDMTYEKIAEKKSLSVKTIEAKMSKALKILRGVLKEYYPLIIFFQYIDSI
ncbi:MAG TPA: RNA polymerase sigma-70 factor [Bacteroidales bacterium]|nr:RNA polymerase sigma-70 factor [Bacteroidales bacterium]